MLAEQMLPRAGGRLVMISGSDPVKDQDIWSVMKARGLQRIPVVERPLLWPSRTRASSSCAAAMPGWWACSRKPTLSGRSPGAPETGARPGWKRS